MVGTEAAAVAASTNAHSDALATKRRNSFSMHVCDEPYQKDPEPIKNIELLAIKDSNSRDEVQKLDTRARWHERRILLTSVRLYILSVQNSEVATGATADNAVESEIMDSIPLHEIESIVDIELTELGVGKSSKRSSGMNWAQRMNSTFSRNSVSEPADRAVSLAGLYGSDGSSLNHINRNSHNEDAKLYETAFQLRTQKDGFNQGAIFCFSTKSIQSRDEWALVISEYSKQAQLAFARQNRIRIYQTWAQSVFNTKIFQGFIATAIAVNFLLTLAQTQIIAHDSGACSSGHGASDSGGEDTTAGQNEIFEKVDTAFTFLFLAELIFNFSAHAVRPFFANRWNWFDLIIVPISVGFLFVSSSDSLLVKQIRIMRAFRIFRIFGRIGQFREIVNALTSAIIPASQALLVGLIVVAVYAAIGTQYFANELPAGFCDFFHSFYTLFGVVAYSQPEGLSIFNADGTVKIGEAVFIYSFVCLIIFVLLQVVVAVLLDNFYKARQRDREAAAVEDSQRARLLNHGAEGGDPMDRLLRRLAAAYDNKEDLNRLLEKTFSDFDSDGTGGVSFAEFSKAVFRLRRARPTHEFYERFTDNYRLCCEPAAAQELDKDGFVQAMLRQLRQYTERKIAEALYVPELEVNSVAGLRTLKVLMVDLDAAERGLQTVGDTLQAGSNAALDKLKKQQETLQSIAAAVQLHRGA